MPTHRYGLLESGFIFKEPLCFPEGTLVILGEPFLPKDGKPRRLLLPVLRYDKECKNSARETVRVTIDAAPATVVICTDLGEAVAKAAIKAYSSSRKKIRPGQ